MSFSFFTYSAILGGMDTVSSETRSRMMAAIHGVDTKPERIVRRALFARGFRYRKNCRDLPGRPDIKLTRYRAIIFVHGCFWHGHTCRNFRLPGSNTGFWSAKIKRNRERDTRNVTALLDSGWRVCVVWECVTTSGAFKTDPSRVVDTVAAWITSDQTFLELYDPGAMNSPNGTGSVPAYTDIGMNEDAKLFAAERITPYASSPGACNGS